MFKLSAATALTSLALGGVAHASDAAKQFGAREAVEDVSLSPDGKYLAIVAATPGRGSAVFVSSVEAPALKAVLRSDGNPDRLKGCAWSTATRLICTIYRVGTLNGNQTGTTRMLSLNADGSNIKELTASNGASALYASSFGGAVLDWLPEETSSTVLMLRYFVPENTAGTIVKTSREGLGVERVDTVSLKRTIVEQPLGAGYDFLTDGHGTVRVRAVQPADSSGYAGRRVVYTYRPVDSKEWKPLSEVIVDSQTFTGFLPVAVDRDLNVVYGYEALNGRKALYKIALDGSLAKELVYASDQVDVGGLLQIGRQKRVVGVSFTTDKPHAIFFDAKLKALAASLSKALPGAPAVIFMDASNDESRLLLLATSDVDPGKYYIFDRATKKLTEVLPVRPELAGAKLSEQKPVRFSAADGTMIPGYLTLPPGSDGKNLPAIVMPHGGPSARDEWGFDWLVQFFANRGYAVLQPNFRGSSGFGEDWFKNNGFKSWQTAMGDVNDAGRWLTSQGIAAPGKLAIFGWSYGGYAALQSSVLESDLFKAIVAVAPVTDLESYRKEWLNNGDYKLVDAFVGRGPHIDEGSPARHADCIKAPVLLFHGDRDLNVGVAESRLMNARLKDAGAKVDYVEFAGLDHYLEDSQVRATMLDKSDAFLRAALGLPAAP